jgi:hypothetical protein
MIPTTAATKMGGSGWYGIFVGIMAIVVRRVFPVNGIFRRRYLAGTPVVERVSLFVCFTEYAEDKHVVRCEG